MLYWRDGLEVVKHLFSNPVFASHMDYDPYREFEETPHGQEPVYGEFMSANRAWEIQVWLTLFQLLTRRADFSIRASYPQAILS